jgi:hypothetical protein
MTYLLYKDGVKAMKGSELFALLEKGEERKAAELFKKISAEAKARGEELPPYLQNYAIGSDTAN